MVKFRLKSIYLEKDSQRVRENVDGNLVILRVGDQEIGTTNYHHFRVPVHATVDIRYLEQNLNSILRIIFQLESNNLSIQYFTWNEDEKHYIDAPHHEEIIQSQSFQHILQSVSFTGENHFSYVTNSLQRLTDQLY